MSSYIAHYGLPTHSSTDADIVLRLGFTLAAWQRAAWRAVRLKSQNGVVRLEGILPTFHDRQLILAVAQHVAGVLRVEDELVIADPQPRGAGSIAASAAEPSLHGGTEVTQPAPPNAFYHLPVLDESLEDILAERARAAVAAGSIS
jgi:hypothetical protein